MQLNREAWSGYLLNQQRFFASFVKSAGSPLVCCVWEGGKITAKVTLIRDKASLALISVFLYKYISISL
jgi:hypothetical protein